jgi:hypothetical protein
VWRSVRFWTERDGRKSDLGECRHPGKEIIEATLEGALVAYVASEKIRFSTEDLIQVLMVMFCRECVEGWARGYSDHCLSCAVGEWIDQHPRMTKIDVPEELARKLAMMFGNLGKGEQN